MTTVSDGLAEGPVESIASGESLAAVEWAGGRLILRGDIGPSEAGGLHGALMPERVIPQRITVDWSGAGRLHSSAIQLLLAYQAHVRSLGGEIEYGEAPAALVTQLRRMGALTYFPSLGDEQILEGKR